MGKVRVFQMDEKGSPVSQVAEYENEKEVLRKHKQNLGRREAVEEHKPAGTKYVPIREWLEKRKRS